MTSSVKTLKEVQAQFEDAVAKGKGTAKATAQVTGWDAQVITFDFSVPTVSSHLRMCVDACACVCVLTTCAQPTSKYNVNVFC